MAVPEESIEIATRHQVMLERLKSGFSKEFEETINKLDKATQAALLTLNVELMSQLPKKELGVFIAELRTLSLDLLTGQEQDFIKDLEKLSPSEAKFEVDSIKEVTIEAKISRPPKGSAFTYANNLPIRATGTLPKRFFSDWKKNEMDQLEAVIRKGWTDGATIPEMSKRLRGTSLARYGDGYSKQAKRRSEAIVRTATQHYSSLSRQKVWEDNKSVVEGYEWVSTLDSRTSQQCRSLDGKKFKVGAGPVPPIHFGCRSTTVASLDPEFAFLKEDATRSARGPSGKSAPVDADQTYYSWLKKQPKGFQDAAIGPTRGKLLRDGGLTADKFAALNLGRDFKPLSLEDMEKINPIAFEKAGIEL